MSPAPHEQHDRPGGGRRLPVLLVAAAVAAGVLTAGIVALATDSADRTGDPSVVHVRDRTSERPSQPPSEAPHPSPVVSSKASTIDFDRFPLDQGWAPVHGRTAIAGPGPDAGGVSMPEGHCDDGVLFGSGFRDRLASHVVAEESSLGRELLRYADAGAARSAYGALRTAVADCATFPDAYTDQVSYVAEVHRRVDEANATAGLDTFTFSYSTRDAAPFGVVYQFAIVGDVLYGSSDYGEWSADSARVGATSLDTANEPLIELIPLIAARGRGGPAATTPSAG